jgi:membrane protein insertase Oxa1/YidC/SpoIIIJ
LFFKHFHKITLVNEMSFAFVWNKYNTHTYTQSPALQIPVFIYFAMDLRKIIEGSDPLLAQKLVESNFLWLTDLTEPDPWYGLPIATGVLLYMNVEVSFAYLLRSYTNRRT